MSHINSVSGFANPLFSAVRLSVLVWVQELRYLLAVHYLNYATPNGT
jgi:hypothetical protein